jgi:hypothetical protein
MRPTVPGIVHFAAWMSIARPGIRTVSFVALESVLSLKCIQPAALARDGMFGEVPQAYRAAFN